MFFNFSE